MVCSVFSAIRTLVKQCRVLSFFLRYNLSPEKHNNLKFTSTIIFIAYYTTLRETVLCGVVNLRHSIRICVTLAFNFSLRIINFYQFRFVTLIGLCLVNPSFHSGKFVIPCHLSSKKDHLIKHLYPSLKVWDRDVTNSNNISPKWISD